jgi:alpha-D-ribose 1-methylphosphonate 5-triphosphate synthase subunit PhnL
VAGLIADAKRRGAAVVGVFHDLDFGLEVGTRRFDLTRLSREAA